MLRKGVPLHACPRCRAVFRTGAGFCPRDGQVLVPARIDPNLGTFVGGYRVLDVLGDGAMGRVYRVEDPESGRRFAMKTLFGETAANPVLMGRFLMEARIMRAIAHRHVIAAVDLVEMGDDDRPGHPFLVMEWAPSGTLEELVDEEGPTSALTALALMKGVLKGLAEAHRRGVVHRDVKPANVLLHALPNGELVPRLTDFGVSRVLGSPHSATLEGTVVGSPSFMSPEQARGEKVDGRADLYAVGATLQAILTGELPFRGTPHDILFAKATLPNRLGKIPGLDPRIQSLIRRLTADNREARPRTAEDAVFLFEHVEAKLRKPSGRLSRWFAAVGSKVAA